MSEPGEPSIPLSLDVVRARIFYLACDVEQVSAPAAMLLRAVAECDRGRRERAEQSPRLRIRTARSRRCFRKRRRYAPSAFAGEMQHQLQNGVSEL